MKKIVANIFESKTVKRAIFFLTANKKTVLALIFASLFADIFFIKISSDLVIFSILLFYGAFTKISQIKSKVTFLVCVSLLCAMFFSYLFTSTSVPAEKAAVWFFLFTALGIFQQWRE